MSGLATAFAAQPSPPPPFLYHGTSERFLDRILREGLSGRGEHGKTNWKRTIESNPKCVYLTDAYPLYFAGNCARKVERWAIIQMPTELLDDGHLVPDEDVLEQAGRGRDGVPGAMNKRTRHYRAELPEFLGRDNWQASLSAMGTCGYMGTIAPAKFARVALLDPVKAPALAMNAIDALICLTNYYFCAAKYRNMTNRLFGLPEEPDPIDGPIDFPSDERGLPVELRALVGARAAYRQRIADELAAGVELRELAL